MVALHSGVARATFTISVCDGEISQKPLLLDSHIIPTINNIVQVLNGEVLCFRRGAA